MLNILNNHDLQKFLILEAMSFALFGLVYTKRLRQYIKITRFFKVSLLIVFLFHLASVIINEFQVGDVMLFSSAGYYFRNGVDYYWIDSDHTQYPFFPFLIFFHAIANKLTYILPMINFVQILKLLLLAALYSIARYLYRSSQLTLTEKRKQVIGFLVNPITYSVVLFHGQIDVILIAFFIYASQILMRSKTLPKVVLAGLIYAGSVATKTWSVIFLPVYLKYFGWKKTIIIGFTSIVFLFADIFIYTRMVFGSGFKVVLPALSKPGGPVGIWGLSFILNQWSDFLAQNNLIIFGGLITLGLILVIFRKLSFWDSVCALLLWVYLIIPNWGVQYLFWVIPFLFITNNPRRNVYLLLGGIYVTLNYVNVIFGNSVINSNMIHWLGLILWGYILFMFTRVLKDQS